MTRAVISATSLLKNIFQNNQQRRSLEVIIIVFFEFIAMTLHARSLRNLTNQFHPALS